MAMATLDIFRSTVGAAALGFARHAMDEALNRVKTRQMFGASMSKLQLIQAKLGDMSLDIDASALLDLLFRLDKGQWCEPDHPRSCHG